MKSVIKIRSVIAGCAAIFTVVMALALPARAADPVFPTGSRLGLVPPPGMLPSHEFPGFEDPDEKAAILFAMLPAAAFDQFEKTVAPEALKKLGIDLDNRESMTLTGGKGFVLSGKQTTYKGHYRKWILVAALGDVTAVVTVQTPEEDTKYPDKAVNDALATLVLRATVPDAERLSMLPFTVGDFAGFHIDDVLPGNALMLTGNYPDQAKDPAGGAGAASAAHFIIAAMPGGPNEPADRDNFARVTFGQIGGITDVRIQDAEPLRISNQSGYQTLAKAKEGQTGTDIMVVQWLRFGNGGFLQMIGIARADGWPETLTRLRTVRDSIDPK